MNDAVKVNCCILAMAILVYLIRVMGFYSCHFIKLKPKIITWLEQLPGCLFMAMVAPEVLACSVSEKLASVAVVLIMLKTKQLLLAVLLGLAFFAAFSSIPI
ncbi:MAG: hypothetical protein K0S29_997 [Gammaproteobacteria bacterium]|jgi:uncharacterized membrane protein|nr:hypothetical protein [Gammaproteobacteria bacterium]